MGDSPRIVYKLFIIGILRIACLGYHIHWRWVGVRSSPCHTLSVVERLAERRLLTCVSAHALHWYHQGGGRSFCTPFLLPEWSWYLMRLLSSVSEIQRAGKTLPSRLVSRYFGLF